MTRRTLIWVSTGAASMVAAAIETKRNPNALLVRCETGNEDPDNYRFEREALQWIGRPITLLRSDEFESVPAVWHKVRYMAGVNGAPCTTKMKVEPRLRFQKPDDIHVFGYTADREDVERFARLKRNYFELDVRAPLIEGGITKAATLAMIENAGIALPRSYAMGFPNANCLQTGCVKAQSPAYWALYRHHFPQQFAETAAYARQIGARLCRIDGERAFIDEIPAGQAMTEAIVPSCDFLCAIAEQDLAG